ncbi:hypothetical protein PC9H_002107 [Pleurotus ostreatus]|uniref:Uncharacterized protein n=1 Tax=Pleurotus ostreatus TaxID=5322 RepID=A0A8H6ZLX7_PLEOS|nr:uncharacterized protein PC9H_002107 [Pleurotus ostreatus]KAF7419516.1 hypothetical protein PC9H_002107 [Pleurotus ostreatus]
MLKSDYPYSITDIALSSIIVDIILGLHAQRSAVDQDAEAHRVIDEEIAAHERGEIVAKKVVCAVERIQTLHVEARTGQDVFKLLLLNASVPASQLERFHRTLPEEINVACLVKDETPELPRIRAKLLNLLRLSIEADDLETRAILANLSFFYFIRPVREPDLSTYSGFFSVLALQTAPTSTLAGLKGWVTCSGSREHVRAPPLPLLQTITISKCRNLLEHRKHLEIPLTKATIMLCCIPESAIRDLEGEDSATIDWEGAEVYSGIEMMCYDDGLDNDIYAPDESNDVALSLAHPDANIKTGPGDRLRTRTNGELIANMH